jgi:RNA polymerase sigma-70 factor, ECF subfamily
MSDPLIECDQNSQPEQKPLSLAFPEVEKAHREEIQRFFLRAGLSKPDAEDQCQLVFIRVFRFLETYRGECSVRTWVYHIATHILSDYKVRRKELLVSDLAVERSGAGQEEDRQPPMTTPWGRDSPDPGEQAEQTEFKHRMDAILGELPEEQRVALILDIEGYSHKDIAQLQQRSAAAVKQAVYRARKQLRGLLEPLAREYGLLK